MIEQNLTLIVTLTLYLKRIMDMKVFTAQNKDAKSKLVVIFSAERYNLHRTENELRTKLTHKLLLDMDLKFKPCQGCYKGTTEQSFMVVTDDIMDIDRLKHLAHVVLEQESILIRDQDGIQLLFGQNAQGYNELQYIGTKFVQVPESELAQCEAYTTIDGIHWIVK